MKSFSIASAVAVAIAAAAALAPAAAHASRHDHQHAAASSAAAHKTTGVVKKVDPQTGRVTVAPEPIRSLDWPAMTMVFQVQDKALLGKLAADKKVDFEFEQRGKQYVITSVK